MHVTSHLSNCDSITSLIYLRTFLLTNKILDDLLSPRILFLMPDIIKPTDREKKIPSKRLQVRFYFMRHIIRTQDTLLQSESPTKEKNRQNIS